MVPRVVLGSSLVVARVVVSTDSKKDELGSVVPRKVYGRFTMPHLVDESWVALG